MRIEEREFEVQVPKADGSGIAEKVKVMVPVYWDEEIQDWLMTPEAHERIDNTKERLMGLLLPEQLKELRERYDYTQMEMGELFQVGEKSWTRWESGKHRPSRVINLLICALYEGEISINYLLKRAGKPPIESADSLTANPPWLVAGMSGPMMPYGIEIGERRLFHLSVHKGKSAFLNKTVRAGVGRISHAWTIVPKGEEIRTSELVCRNKRFDFQNTQII